MLPFHESAPLAGDIDLSRGHSNSVRDPGGQGKKKQNRRKKSYHMTLRERILTLNRGTTLRENQKSMKKKPQHETGRGSAEKGCPGY